MSVTTLFPLQYQRQDAVPVDIDQVFVSTSARNAYLTSPRRYAGMIAVDLEAQQPLVLSADRTTWINILTALNTSSTVSSGDSNAVTGDAVHSYVQTQISALVNGAPTLLDTLNEIAAAINNDPNFYNDLLALFLFKADKLVVGDITQLTSGLITEINASGFGSSYTGTAAVTNGNNVIVLSVANKNFAVGNAISGTGIPGGTTISAVDSTFTHITLSANATATNGTVTVTTLNKVDLVAAINVLYNKTLNSQPTLSQSLTVQLGTGVNFGGVSTGQSFSSGTLIENLLRSLLIKTIPPTYNAPSASLSTNISTAGIEVGTLITPQLTLTFSQNDAGAESSQKIQLNGSDLTGSGSSPFTAAQIQVVETANNYQGIVAYAAGACKTNNLGATDCTGSIPSGSVGSNVVSYVGYRNLFYGFPTSAPSTSANVRGLGNNVLNPSNGTTFTIVIPSGSTAVSFSYPASLEDVSSVKYVELANSEVKGNFTQTIVSVQGANGYTAISYKVYTYIPVEAFSQTVHYTVTI